MEPKPMRIDSKDAAKTPTAPGAAVPEPDKFIRRLDHPYFELRTPDAQASTYVEGNSAKMIMADEEKLSRFLAVAHLVTDQNTTPKKRLIRYEIDPEKYKNIRPLDAIPESELKAFEEAAKDFYDKAAPDRKDVHPYETFLRLNFKLPDPEREPDAYLVYGTEFERQLLVLWGAEKQKDTSLPIAMHEVVRLRKGEETVADKLRRRVIGWEQMQKDTLLLLAKTREPLFRFLGEPVIDDKGVLKGVKIGEVALTSAQIRPLRYILPPEMKAFQKACADFYSRADTATSAYEKELRRNFQLPDPDKMPGSFRVHGPFNGPRLVVLCDMLVRREQTIALTPWPKLNIPPMPPVTPEQELLGHKPEPPPTLTDKLQHKVIPFGKIFAVGGAIIATPIVIALLIWLALDKSPPKLASVIPAEEPKAVLAEFNEPIDAASLPKEAAAISKTFVLMNSNTASPVTILSATLNTTGKNKNREIKLMTGVEFADGAGYNLSVNNLKDRAMLHNQIKKAIHFGFVYEDAKPPVMGMPSGDGESMGHLELPFSKIMDADSVKDVANYAIDGSNFKVNSASLDEDKKTVSLVFTPDMQLKTDHTIVVKNIKDSSKKGNKLNPNPTTMDFKFIDTLPPKLRKVTAEEQNKVVLEFNEKLNPASVTNLANYALTLQKDGAKLDIYLAELVDPKKVSLLTAPLHHDINYDVTVVNVGDVADPSNVITNVIRSSFKLDPSRENHQSPHIENISQAPDRTKIIVNFGVTNRLRPDLVLGRGSFVLKMLSNDKEMDYSSTIVSVTDPFVADYPPGIERVSILLSAPLEKAQTYKVTAKGLQDIWGNTNAASDAVLAVKGFIKELQSQSVKFADSSKRIISITLSWEIDESSLAPANFIVPGRKVTGVEFGDNHYVLRLKLDGPVTADHFTVSCLNLRLAGTSVVGPQLDCSGPDH